MAAPIHALRAKRAQHLPTVLSKIEVNQVLGGMQGLHQLMARLLYGCGLRLMESLRLRVKDIDFEQSQVVVHEGKGEKDRLTMLPISLMEPLTAQITFVAQQHTRDLTNGFGLVELPFALALKYPNADKAGLRSTHQIAHFVWASGLLILSPFAPQCFALLRS